VLLALGPLFIVMALFDATRRFFEAWLHELSNYALVTILTVMVSALMLDLVQAYAEQTAARGAALMTVDALNLALAAGLVLLVLRQIPPLAARLAGGFALSSFGTVERAAQTAVGVARGVAVVTANTLEEPEPTRQPVWRPAAGTRTGGGS
jgi:type IV secretion system protein VirB6